MRQTLPKVLVQRLERRGERRRQVADQPTQAGAVLGEHGAGFAHPGKTRQARGDLAQLDAEAVELDLVVEPAEVFQHAVLAHAYAVASAIAALAAARIDAETLGGLLRLAEIATRQADAAEVQFPGHAQRQRRLEAVEHLHRGAGQRSADGRLVERFGVQVQFVRRRIGGVLGRPVEIDQAPYLGLATNLSHQVAAQRFAGQVQRAHPARQVAEGEQRGAHRGHGIEQADLVAARVVRQAEQVFHQVQRAAFGQGAEQLVDRQVEAHRGRRQYPAPFFGGIVLAGPAQEGMGATVLDGDALGASGGTGGVDDVGEVVGADLARGQRQVVRLVAALLQRQAWPAQRGDPLAGASVDQHQQAVGVVEHVGHPLLRIGRVQRDVATAGAEHAKQADQQAAVAPQADPDPLLRSHPGGAQAHGERGAFALQLGIAEATVGGVHGDALRCAPRLGLEQMVEYAARRGGLGLAAQGLQTALFVGVQPGQPADAGLGVDQAARQAREMAGDTPQFVVLGIAQSQADAAVRRQHQGQPAGAARRRPRRQHLDRAAPGQGGALLAVGG